MRSGSILRNPIAQAHSQERQVCIQSRDKAGEMRRENPEIF